MKMAAKIAILIIALTLVATPLLIFAQGTGYVPLAPIGEQIPEGQPIGLPQYLRAAFAILIGIAGVLAVIVIMIGGIQYITTDSFTDKTEGKEKITRALLGLILAIAAWLILNTINPNILSLRIGIEPPPATQAPPPPPSPPKYVVTYNGRQTHIKASCDYDFGQAETHQNFPNEKACQDWLANAFRNNPNARMDPPGNRNSWFNEKLDSPPLYCRSWQCIPTDDSGITFETIYTVGTVVEAFCTGEWRGSVNPARPQFNSLEACESWLNSEKGDGGITGPPRCESWSCREIK